MIVLIVGTVAETLKIIPIILELRKQKKQYRVLNTAQHNIHKILKTYKIDEKIIDLNQARAKGTTHFGIHTILWCWRTLWKIRTKLVELQPNHVLYHGDTMTTTLAALASNYKNDSWQTHHVEAGLRSHNIFEPFPEEISRIIADTLTDHNYCSEKQAVKNIKRAKYVGNTITDLVYITLSKFSISEFKQSYAVANFHRQENITSKKRLEQIVFMLNHNNIQTVLPLHENTKQQLIKFSLLQKLRKHIKICPLLDYPSFLILLKRCSFIMTDGGSIQEEAHILKKPIILLRYATERETQEKYERGAAKKIVEYLK